MAEPQEAYVLPVPDNAHYATDVLVEAGRAFTDTGTDLAELDVVILTVAGFQQDQAGNRIPTTTKVLFPRDYIPVLVGRLAGAYNYRPGA